MSHDPDPPDGPTAPQRSLAPKGDRAWVDRVIAGKYRVEGVLGRGAMGIVLKARHMRLDEPVAIKVMHASLANDKDMVERMLREARAVVRLSSEHIVRVMDADTLEDGVPYLVLEYLEGTDVASLLRRRGGSLSVEEVIPIADQACRALIEAHALGIVHRDLKPANLFIVSRPDGRRVVKLLDFGISKISEGRTGLITRKGDIIGSPRYMSPEQVRAAGAIDGRADIWSMGVLLYEMLSGATPFDKGNFARTCNAVLREPHTPLAAACPHLPPSLTAVVERCLEKDRDRRFPDAAALRDALSSFGPVSLRSSLVSLPEPSADSVRLHPRDSSAGPPSSVPGPSSGYPGMPAEGYALAADGDGARTTAFRRRPRVFLAIAIVGLVLGVAAGVVFLSSDANPSAAQGKGTPPAAPVPTGAAQTAHAVSGAALGAAQPPSAASNTSSAAAPGEPPPASLPARRPLVPTGAPSAAASAPAADDPFGERRQ